MTFEFELGSPGKGHFLPPKQQDEESATFTTQSTTCNTIATDSPPVHDTLVRSVESLPGTLAAPTGQATTTSHTKERYTSTAELLTHATTPPAAVYAAVAPKPPPYRDAPPYYSTITSFKPSASASHDNIRHMCENKTGPSNPPRASRSMLFVSAPYQPMDVGVAVDPPNHRPRQISDDLDTSDSLISFSDLSMDGSDQDEVSF